jgi:hypothetical protein
MIHAMIDLETLSTNPNATVLTVGGVKFDPYTTAEPSQGMYFRVDVDSQTEMGRDVMQDTLEWWGRQDPEIMEEALGDKDHCSTTQYYRIYTHSWDTHNRGSTGRSEIQGLCFR